jgi:hypothetical protein
MLVCVSVCQAQEAIFDADPQHIWNRLHCQLYTRTTLDGQSYHQEDLEAAFVPRSTFLIQGESHEQAIHLLDEFLQTDAQTLIRDSLSRAILQRDLWAVFSATAYPRLEHQSQRRELQQRLAQVMRRVALSAEEIAALPDNLEMAIDAETFPVAYDNAHPERSFLPRDLMQSDGDWVPLGNRLRPDGLVAPVHVKATNGRAVFFMMLRLPTGRAATEKYLATLQEVQAGQGEIPQIPLGTQVALLRRLMLIDDTGQLQLSPLTESLQIRVYQKLEKPDMYEFSLHRHDLLSSRGTGLRPTTADTASLFNLGFLSLEPRFRHDPLESNADKTPRIPAVVMQSCAACHPGPGIYGFQSMFVDHFDKPPLGIGEFADQTSPVIDRTYDSYGWGLLQGLW